MQLFESLVTEKVCFCNSRCIHLESNIDALEKLIQDGADPDLKDLSGNGCLHYDISYEEMKLFLEYGANPNLKNTSGMVPLDIYAPDTKMGKLLMKYGACSNERE